MALKGPIVVEASTVALWNLDGGASSSGAWKDEKGTYTLGISNAAPTYEVSGYGQSKNDATDEGIDITVPGTQGLETSSTSAFYS